MAILTPVSLDDARRLGARYGLAVSAVRGIPAGSVNSSYELSLEGGGRVFLRVYEEQGAPAARAEARLLDRLAARGVPTPRPLPLAGDGARDALRDGSEAPAGFVAEHAGKPVAMFPWVSGETLCQARVTPAAAREVGAALARVHLAGATERDAPASRFGPAELTGRLAPLESAALPDELRAATRMLEAELAEVARGPALPDDGLVHGDLFRDNVLWADGRLAALLDFESASRGSFAFDLMVTALAWCFGAELDPALLRALAAGYTSVRPLLPDERDALHRAGRFAAIRFATTRITDFELRPAGTGIHKDYRRFLARLAALDRLGPAGLLRAMGLG